MPGDAVLGAGVTAESPGAAGLLQRTELVIIVDKWCLLSAHALMR
jgi:hypothetical protein